MATNNRTSKKTSIRQMLNTFLYSSVVGTTIRRTLVAVAVAIIVAFLFFSYQSNKRALLASSHDLVMLNTACIRNSFVEPYKEIVAKGKALAQSFAATKDSLYVLKANRNDIVAILYSNAKMADNCSGVGMYWEWNRFDNQEENLKLSPDYKKWYGRLAMMFVKEGNNAMKDLDFEFNESQCEAVHRHKHVMLFPPEQKSFYGVKKNVMPLYVPIMRDETYFGCVVYYVDSEFIQQCCQNSKFSGKDSQFIIYDNNLVVIAASDNPSACGHSIVELYGKEFDRPELFSGKQIENTEKNVWQYVDVVEMDENETKWALLSITADGMITDNLNNTMIPMIILSVIILLLAAFVGIFLGYRIGYPLVLVLNACRKLSNGVMTYNMNFKTYFHNEIAALYNEFANMSRKLKDIVVGVKQSAAAINNSGIQFSKSAQTMSAGANEQASASEQLSAAMEDMSQGIRRNSNNAKETETIANRVVDSVREANDSVMATVSAMKNMSEKIGIINEIAGKTDLLAVNAAIEAARAGELGKGFAVVASEIRKLAEKSQRAAKEIDILTANVVSQAEKSGHKLEILVPEINKTSQLVQEITASSIEQEYNASQVNNALQQLNDITQQNASTAEQLSSGATESLRQAETLNETMSFFKIGDAKDSEIADLNSKIVEMLKRIEYIQESEQ